MLHILSWMNHRPSHNSARKTTAHHLTVTSSLDEDKLAWYDAGQQLIHGAQCLRWERLSQPCSYNQVVQRRTRNEQLLQLQERLAKTEAQLARAMPTVARSSQLTR
ncbi:hypothetical protein CCHR01_10663 [Colletotrichum chrysophilum]|uniref:Uncharacterized protein n=1 Tax=Colletotrichum chrysophilum TaxID=1836956 RepID=A0AAD9EFI6_9PEZI|nr:hypothetical protein CCHR01_10663 [Colletotrichum chrysophilum]